MNNSVTVVCVAHVVVGVLWVEQEGWTPLHDASYNGHLKVCKWLVAECGCDVSAKDYVSCSCCLTYAP